MERDSGRHFYRIYFCAVAALAIVAGCNHQNCSETLKESFDDRAAVSKAAACVDKQDAELLRQALETRNRIMIFGEGMTIREAMNSQMELNSGKSDEQVNEIVRQAGLDQQHLPQSTKVGGGPLSIRTSLVERAVVFLYGGTSAGQPDEKQALGTGLLVSVPSTQDPQKFIPLLVTARHIVDKQWALCSHTSVPASIYMRLNKKGTQASDATQVAYEAVGTVGQVDYHVSDDPTVDAAVFMLPKERMASFANYDSVFMPISLFADSEDLKALTPGDQVLTAGLLSGYSGSKRNYPFFRLGTIASTSEEPIRVLCGVVQYREVKGFLIAAHLVAGNSGSPIFQIETAPRKLLNQTLMPVFVGVQSNSYVADDVAGFTDAGSIFEIIQKIVKPYDVKLDHGRNKSQN